MPLFLRMPPWNDVTLHDMAARGVLRGGVHYRDVFDTNLPGIDWAMAAIRAAFGWGYPVLRAFDLLVIGLQVFVLWRWVKAAGGTAASAAWFAAAACLFYPFTSEFSHAQRDPWMALPAVLAARMRLRQMAAGLPAGVEVAKDTAGKPAAIWSVGEGFVWGLAVWFKPHVVVPALAVWVVSVIFLKQAGQSVRRDLLALIAGGLLAGLPGVAWLVGTGAWPHFLDVFTNWNPSYVADAWATLPSRGTLVFVCFWPWGLLHLAAIPLAAAWVWKRDGAARSVLAALYLGFLAQGVVLQKGFDFVHVPEFLVGVAVLACRGWAAGFGFLVWFALAAVLPFKLEKNRLFDRDLIRHWPRCFGAGDEMGLRDDLGVFTHAFLGTTWRDLNRVAAHLRTVSPPLGDRELTAWHDTTHPLYLMLNVEPSTRYMHFGTAFGIKGKAKQIAEEVAASRQRFVVSDLRRMTHDAHRPLAPGEGGDPLQLPAWFPASQRDKFPWNQPVVFRAGRYVVHEVTEPLGEIDIPDWPTLDQLGPGR